ncbi:MAG: response regulator [Microbacterium sp.]|uniref:response regulator n=1 Tax=Microbacterium sp. TaxID=51671 RepID=UPI001ACCA31B|nr:response regulator [Microbacterium sp.]MBN9175833.1 response regulator [Microbacterium sp.]
MTTALSTLVIDDDFRVADLHRGIVDRHPAFVTLPPARTLREAAETVRTATPDLLLVDAYLPDGDGIGFIGATDVDAIVLSAAADAPTIRRALRAGALGYLVKPFDARALTTLLDRYVRFRNVLAGDRGLAQEEIDRARGILAGDATPSVSRSATEQLILESLGRGEASSSEIAERSGISRATAQRHLSSLATRGLVEVRLRYGTTGRPEHLYAVGRG